MRMPNTMAAKPALHAALPFAELVGKRLGDGKGQHRVQHAQHVPRQPESLTLPKNSYTGRCLHRWTTEATDHAGQAEEHNAQQSLIVRDLLSTCRQFSCPADAQHFHAPLHHTQVIPAQHSRPSIAMQASIRKRPATACCPYTGTGADHDRHDNGHEDGAAMLR